MSNNIVPLYAKILKTAARVFLIGALAILIFLGGLTASLNVIRHRRAQRFLNALRTVKVGSTTGSEALKVAHPFDAQVYIHRHTELPSGFSDQLVDVPPADCISGNCTVSFGPDAPLHWLSGIYYPFWTWPVLRKWVPISGIYASVTVEHGIVSELQITLESIQEKEVHTARTVVASNPSLPTWNIERYTAFHTGGPGKTSPTVEVRFNPRTRYPKQESALDFNLNCLRVGRSCSQCEILPGICEDEEHGEWFYFEMPDDLLKTFQSAVNKLPLGISEDSVVSRLGCEWGGFGSWDLFDDKLPYRFPDGTNFGDIDPPRLIYYVKKWRERREGNNRDQTVTLVFDKQDRLVRIVSQADGVRNRP